MKKYIIGITVLILAGITWYTNPQTLGGVSITQINQGGTGVSSITANSLTYTNSAGTAIAAIATSSILVTRYYSFGMMGTTTTNTITGTTTAQASWFKVGATINNVSCVTDVGTVDVKWTYGPTPTQVVYIVGASSTPGVYTLTTNNTPAANASSTVTIGKPASSPTSVSCTATLSTAGL